MAGPPATSQLQQASPAAQLTAMPRSHANVSPAAATLLAPVASILPGCQQLLLFSAASCCCNLLPLPSSQHLQLQCVGAGRACRLQPSSKDPCCFPPVRCLYVLHTRQHTTHHSPRTAPTGCVPTSHCCAVPPLGVCRPCCRATRLITDPSSDRSSHRYSSNSWSTTLLSRGLLHTLRGWEVEKAWQSVSTRM
jgi:hypothetical protein